MELTKQQKNCPYCRSKRTDDNLEIYQSEDNGYLSISSDGDVEIDEGNWVMEESEKTSNQSLIMVFHEILKFITLMAKSLWKKKASLI